VYWLPLYSYVRLAHRATPQDAEDITQGFFADALRRDLFARYEPSRARFRTFLRTCLDSYAANERKASSRLKRGGDAVTIPLDIAELEGRLRTESDVDATFHREWVRSVFAAAVARLQRTYADTNRSAHFDAFHRYDILGAESDAKPTYAQLAADLGVTPTQVTNWLFSTRRDFRRAVLDTLRDICGSDEELRDESRLLLGVDPPSE
jgi:DNA-directed RNA polymerase specialized sigma24 family protein